MLNLGLGKIEKVLCLGAHADDIEIGCGGAILRLVEENPNVEVCWVVLSATGERRGEALAGARSFLSGLESPQILTKDFRDSYFPDQWSSIKDFLHELSGRFSPDVVFTHRRNDAHQDHRVTGELTWCAFRNQLVLEYEIPKYEGDLGQPNVLVPISESTMKVKTSHLLEVFASQRDKYWFSAETFHSLARLRGLEANAGELYAEGFYCRKLVL